MNTMVFFSLILISVCIYYGVKAGFLKLVLPILANIVSILFLCLTRDLWADVLFEWVLQDISLIIVRIVVLALLYIIVMALIKLVIASLHILSKLPVLHFFDRVLGIVAGAVQGVLILWLVLAVVFLLKDTELGLWAVPQINETSWLAFLYDNNLIVYIISGFIK